MEGWRASVMWVGPGMWAAGVAHWKPEDVVWAITQVIGALATAYILILRAKDEGRLRRERKEKSNDA